ncbi:RNA polymerase sigma factor [Streptomyces sp. CB01881]|uniref:RNA polymerase sigma factor n=1 Tax=Streptomyces sp. CB01881 TaxID=2078691 RepID=UPI000CDC534E|nr:RNA polymerase sigma factor [Streptomyces sp. CB01881]AUY54362.1 RNA polymerase sigma factor [Streptomyces sp. CB01881]TYC75267.1 RNA polymerase sigma factor [Streptomyces sp. CB01881]
MWRVQSAERPGAGTDSPVGRPGPPPTSGPPAGPPSVPPPGAAPADLSAAVRAAQDGDEEAFRLLFRSVQPGLLRYLRVLVGGRPEDAQDAEDIASEAWLQIARDLRTFSGDGDGFRGWAATIARNRALDHLRARRRRPVADLPFEYLSELAAGDDTAGAALASVGTADALALISRLPRDQAEAVLLRVVMELDAESAARVLGKKSGSVRMAAHRGLRRLAKVLEQSFTAGAGIPAQSLAGPSGQPVRQAAGRGAGPVAGPAAGPVERGGKKNSAQGVTERRAATLKDMR